MNRNFTTPRLWIAAALPCFTSACSAQAPAPSTPPQASKASKIKWPVRSNATAPAGREIAAQAPLARAILDGWNNQNPVRGARILRIVYWTPGDREPAPRYRERLSAIMLDIQAFYAREMARNGFGPRTFQLPVQPDGQLQVLVSKGDKPRTSYSGETGGEIRADAIKTLKAAGIDGDKETFLIFCNLANWNPATRDTQDGGAEASGSPYYASGTTRRGTAWQSDSAVLNLDDLSNVDPALMVSGQYGKTTLARYNAIFIGGIAHELGHALSMPHNKERPDMAAWGRSLMGAGNRTYGEELRFDAKNETKQLGSFLPLADAMRLASHPSFSGSVKGFDGQPNADIRDAKLTTDGKAITYSARVTVPAGAAPVYGVVAYFDPAGGQDYDATSATAVPGRDGRFTLSSDALAPGKSGVLRVVTLQANGTASSAASGGGREVDYPYSIGADGTVDLSRWNTQQVLAPLSAAVARSDRAGIEKALRDLQAQNAPANLIEVARVQLASLSPAPKIGPAVASGDSLFLSEATPTSAQVGWLRPDYDRLAGERGASLLSSGGQYFARGIYAHAPAKHVYELGGKWKSFSGVAGAPDGKSPSVAFVILGDGKELWRKPIKEAESAPFALDVSGVQSLELRVEDGGNGNSSDWAAWLDPKLSR